LTIGYQEPLADLSQDYILTRFNESNGKNFFEFHRKRNTGDTKDIEIKVKLHTWLKTFYFFTKQMFLRTSPISNMAGVLIDYRIRTGI